MSDNNHPSYKNPIIQEAFCEIRFTGEEGVIWDPRWYGSFFKEVSEEFPVFEPSSVLQPGQIQPLVRYVHKSRPVLIQLAPAKIVLNILRPYPGWAQMKEDVLYAWRSAVAVIRPRAITSIGLRYINAIPVHLPDDTLGNWLVPNEYMTSVVLNSLRGAASQIQTVPNERELLSVSVGERVPVFGAEDAFIMDIDTTYRDEIETTEAVVQAEANRLHDRVWEVFNASKGERLERLLNGDLL